ncbi:phage anti-repressor protein/ribosomal protein S20 [Virgibacillus natechei]|uniref:Phage anti-repressor protein/ribosomal protein S20 n=1 Tax=Virgibacillus natechei TaxID=1216297 RepID=A0ABS4IL10_9BACI|nr:antA/AntB antirepressor family protein [Virgibacillus natechei]MBP1971637.1 phage anti-repressor protein/ribosomal protein S20 [Virgibacillus natechei]UZD13037.1 antA/AntB antirepressor family protein [Virgibacillus natechei]
MNQLKTIADEVLPVYEKDTGEKLVSARELHQQLFSKQEFVNWIKRRIDNYGFIEGEDFLTTLSKSTGGRPSTEYLLLLDTAKEVAMVENNEQGRAIRKYFIQVEKQSKVEQPKTQLEILQGTINQMVMQEKDIKQIKQENEALKHRMDNYDKIDQLGDLQQRLNNMIRKYAAQNGIAFPEAWRHFRRSFNNSYRTNIKTLMKNFQTKHGLKSITAPQYLSMSGRLEDAVRVADKMLNQQTFLTNKELI